MWRSGAQLIALLLPVLACGACSAPPASIDIATTTSVQNSGLLESVLPHFPDATVRVHAAGSGRALAMLSDGIVDLVISHAPETEARALAEHPGWAYRKIAYNRFVLVGPPSDPAGVRGSKDVADAFPRIASQRAVFVSRGDESGTHERERALWAAAGVRPEDAQLQVSGQGMAVTLRQASEQGAYTLADQATFWQLERQIELVPVVEADPLLLNTYAVVHPETVYAATRLATWLAEGDGRARVATFRVQGRIAFTVWPSECPGDTPAALPCQTRPARPFVAPELRSSGASRERRQKITP